MQKLTLYQRWAQRIPWEAIDPEYLKNLIRCAADEDLRGYGLFQPNLVHTGDVTTRILRINSAGRAYLVMRKDGILCGIKLIPLILQEYGPTITCQPAIQEGSRVSAGTIIAAIEGPVVQMLEAERVILNFIQRLSGIATHTARHVAALGNSPTKLLDTRKTTPGWRVLEKYAVTIGGGWNHRLGLYDRILIKDNHLAAMGAKGPGIAKIIRLARREAPELPLEIELDRIDQIPWALEGQPDVILLDNFSLEDLEYAINLIAGKALTEASGSVNLASLPTIGQLGLDFVSCGALTHQAPWIDIGLDWE